jgi:hypothetical protein
MEHDQAEPDGDVSDVELGYAALRASAVDLGASGKDNLHGWGRPNALGTLDFCATIFKDGFESGGTGQWN